MTVDYLGNLGLAGDGHQYGASGDFDGLFPEGFLPANVRRQSNARYLQRLTEASNLWLDCVEGTGDPYLLRQAIAPTSPIACEILMRRYPTLFSARETMTTGDFTALTADILDRQIIAKYTATPKTWPMIMKEAPLRDFRTVKRFAYNGSEKPWNSVAENQTHQRQKLTEVVYTYAPLKYLSGTEPMSFESMINDDLGLFNDLPARFSNGGVRTVEKFATGLYCDVSGPHASLYTAGNANIVNIANGAAANNPPLSLNSLGDGLTILRKMRDAGGDPITILGKLMLVVGPDLEVTANNLAHQLEVWLNEKGGSTSSQVHVGNWLVQNLSIIVNPYIPIIATTANSTTSWWLIADPNAGNRPVFEIGMIRGYDTPVLLEKQSNTMRAGGGIAQELGDWDSMTREMKGLLTVGGTQLDGKSTVASNGSNS